jgi:2-hydroxychromene-2-carboxylate isomerase
MGSLIASYETLGPAQIPPKRDFLFRQCLRRAKKMGLEFRTPARLPFNPVEVLRLGTSSLSGALQVEMIETLFNAVWRDGIDMENESQLACYLDDHLNVSLNDLSAPLALKEARKELKENLKLAKQLNAFGVPSFVVEGELFWGHDALADFDRWLEGDDELDHDEYDRFLKLF